MRNDSFGSFWDLNEQMVLPFSLFSECNSIFISFGVNLLVLWHEICSFIIHDLVDKVIPSLLLHVSSHPPIFRHLLIHIAVNLALFLCFIFNSMFIKCSHLSKLLKSVNLPHLPIKV